MILDSSFYRVRKLTSNAYITYRFDDRLVMRHFIPCTSAILYTICKPNRLGCESNGCFESGATRGSYRACAGNVPVGNMMPAPLKPSSQQKHTAVSMKKPNCRNPHPGENVRFRLTGTNLL